MHGYEEKDGRRGREERGDLAVSWLVITAGSIIREEIFTPEPPVLNTVL